MKPGNITVWVASMEPSKPLCVSADDWSLTIFMNDQKEVTGVLRHQYFEDRACELVEAKGSIPAEYYLHEEKSRI